MHISLKIASTAVLALFLFASCARAPSPKRSSNIIQRHFKKYAKRYKSTVYAKGGGVSEVEVTSQQEIRKHLVAIEAFITLRDGTVQRIHATVEKDPLGWRFVSWENATGI